MPTKEIIVKCRSCGYEWALKKEDPRSILCPKCGIIGPLNEQFDLIKFTNFFSNIDTII